MEENLRNTTQRETHLTEHLNAVTQAGFCVFRSEISAEIILSKIEKYKPSKKRADSVTCRNEELQKDLINAQLESTRLRKDCTQLVQEIEKLRQEQTEDRKRAGENERLTAQLGRQIAEQKSALEKEQIEIFIVSLFLI